MFKKSMMDVTQKMFFITIELLNIKLTVQIPFFLSIFYIFVEILTVILQCKCPSYDPCKGIITITYFQLKRISIIAYNGHIMLRMLCPKVCCNYNFPSLKRRQTCRIFNKYICCNAQVSTYFLPYHVYVHVYVLKLLSIFEKPFINTQSKKLHCNMSLTNPAGMPTVSTLLKRFSTIQSQLLEHYCHVCTVLRSGNFK